MTTALANRRRLRRFDAPPAQERLFPEARLQSLPSRFGKHSRGLVVERRNNGTYRSQGLSFEFARIVGPISRTVEK